MCIDLSMSGSNGMCRKNFNWSALMAIAYVHTLARDVHVVFIHGPVIGG